MNLDIKEGVIEFQNELYKSLAVFEKDIYYSNDELKNFQKSKQLNLYVPQETDVIKSDNLREEYCNYRKFITNDLKNRKSLKIHKIRHYLKVIKPEYDINEAKKVLTFVLFNPSCANQYKLDATIANCAYLTFKNKNYNGFEILNLINLRDTKTNLIFADWKNFPDVCIYKKVVFNDVVLAWGQGKNKEIIIKHQWEKINNRFKNSATKYYSLYADIDVKEILHFGNVFWNSKKLPFKKSLDEGKITLKAITKDDLVID